MRDAIFPCCFVCFFEIFTFDRLTNKSFQSDQMVVVRLQYLNLHCRLIINNLIIREIRPEVQHTFHVFANTISERKICRVGWNISGLGIGMETDCHIIFLILNKDRRVESGKCLKNQRNYSLILARCSLTSNIKHHTHYETMFLYG